MSENLKVYTVDDLTEMLGTTKNAVYCLLKKNYFRSIKIGGLYRIPKKGFDDWLEGKPEDGAQDVFEEDIEDPLADERYLDGRHPDGRPVGGQHPNSQLVDGRCSGGRLMGGQHPDGDGPKHDTSDRTPEETQDGQKDLSRMSPEELMKEFMDAWEKSSTPPAKKPKCL